MQPLDSSELILARDQLLAGNVVAIPTETVYGLAAAIQRETGLKKIFSLKERPFFDPLIVHVASFKEAQTLTTEWSPLADYVARVFWPGPLTLVLPKSEIVSSLITSGLATVAIRYPAHPVAQDLIRLVGQPLAAPSANKFGKTSPSRAEHVRSEFPGSGLLIIDGGECEVGLESTVIRFAKDPQGADQIEILRPGGITQEMLQDSLKKWGNPVSVVQGSSQASPGHLEHHYMPKIPLVIVPESLGAIEPKLKELSEKLKLSSITRPAELILSESAELAARELYVQLREVAESGADLIFVRASKARQSGLWVAIWDRLTRAASLIL